MSTNEKEEAIPVNNTSNDDDDVVIIKDVKSRLKPVSIAVVSYNDFLKEKGNLLIPNATEKDLIFDKEECIFEYETPEETTKELWKHVDEDRRNIIKEMVKRKHTECIKHKANFFEYITKRYKEKRELQQMIGAIDENLFIASRQDLLYTKLQLKYTHILKTIEQLEDETNNNILNGNNELTNQTIKRNLDTITDSIDRIIKKRRTMFIDPKPYTNMI